MGAWGAGTFDNDAAADFLLEYEDAGVGVVVQAFEMVLEGQASGYIDFDAGSWGLAASEIVAFSHGRASSAIDEETLNSMRVHEMDVRAIAGGPKAALTAVGLIASSEGKSELFDLWSEGELLDEWLSGVSDLKSRLEGIAA
ncbi:DUF4259 domain-containing protein [Roseovarius sp. 2305UL8-3]|uniref:DUF4259 domain-containing protein n=1 Tax=Roseovarius conchicola TaxID=3121636 RepID=UPI0035287943